MTDRSSDRSGPRDRAQRTALHYAALGLHADIAGLRIAQGARVDARNSFGATPLLEALSEVMDDDDGDIVRVLLDAGADPRAENNTGVSTHSLAERVSNVDLMRFFRDGA